MRVSTGTDKYKLQNGLMIQNICMVEGQIKFVLHECKFLPIIVKGNKA